MSDDVEAIRSIVERHFGDRLRQLGFAPSRDVPCVWTRPTGHRSELMVEIEKVRGARQFSVWLRRRGAQEAQFDLAEAAGLRWYEYRDDAGLDAAMAEARRHFDAWGIDWLEGRPITSPALEAKAHSIRQYKHGRLTAEGRLAFKTGAYDEAVAKFGEAGGLAPLDDVSAKMLAMALRKRGVVT